jgi:DNA-binding beta-propeller fold protein YncE
MAFVGGDETQFYVVDGDGGPNNRLVAVEWSTGKVLWHVGGVPSSAPGLFDVPHSIAYDSKRNALWVADRSNNRTQVLSVKDGSFLFEWACFVPGGQPWGVRVDNARGSIIVADGTMGNVYIFDDSTTAADAAPSCNPAQTIPVPPAASHLHEMAVDEATGDVYIAQVGVPTGLVRIKASAQTAASKHSA